MAVKLITQIAVSPETIDTSGRVFALDDCGVVWSIVHLGDELTPDDWQRLPDLPED